MLIMILTGIGLAAGTGLNAYLPLLVLALADRFTDVIELDTPWDIFSSFWGLVVLLLILPLELIPDKIAKVDHVSDLVHSAIRPAVTGWCAENISASITANPMACEATSRCPPSARLFST